MIANGIAAAATYLLIALGFGMVYSVCRFFNFAHAIIFTCGAYFVYFLNIWLGLPFVCCPILAIILSAVLGCSLESCFYQPLRSKGASQLILLLASLGIYVVIQNVISLIFGDETKIIRFAPLNQGINLLIAKLTSIQILSIFLSILLFGVVTSLSKWSKIGKAVRAVANDRELSGICGIESDRVILWIMAVSSSLAGLAGILVALDVDMTPTMGMRALMMAIVVVIISGIGSLHGVALGAIALGLAQHLVAWKIGSQWQDSTAFVVPLGLLLFKPEGLFGKKSRKARV